MYRVQNMIIKKSEQYAAKAKEVGQKIELKIENTKKTYNETVQNTKDKYAQAKQTTKDKYEQTKENAKLKLEDTKQKLQNSKFGKGIMKLRALGSNKTSQESNVAQQQQLNNETQTQAVTTNNGDHTTL